MSKSVTKKPRKRGTASHVCPKCGGNSHVVYTKREEDTGGVRRWRECKKRTCKTKFTTVETLAA